MYPCLYPLITTGIFHRRAQIDSLKPITNRPLARSCCSCTNHQPTCFRYETKDEEEYDADNKLDSLAQDINVEAIA